jgi:TonB-linked SusC/RagA family outer membrane protein
LTVDLVPDDRGLDEVVITGYTREQKSRYTGATAKVNAGKINQVPVASIDQILQGRAPGLFVAAGSGQPGQAATVRIRGAGSISGITAPLYIMDGIPIEGAAFQSLNPSDIESVDVLKDATSTALYGSRGANGVIVITTKRGKAGRTNFGARTQWGFANRTTPKFTMMNSQQRIAFEKEMGQLYGDTYGPGWFLARENPDNAGVPESELKDYDKWLDSLSSNTTDWPGIFFRTGRTQEHEVSASGGNERSRFYTSVNYFKQDGIANRSDMERFTFRANLDFSSKRFTGAISTGIGFTRRNFIEGEAGTSIVNPFSAVYYALPYEQPYVNGELLHSGNGTYGVDYFDVREGSDALERQRSTTNRNNQLKGTISGNFKFKITPDLSAVGTLGLDFRETVGERLIKPDSYTGTLAVGGRGSFNENFARNIQILGNGGLVYAKTIGDRHDFDVSALFEALRDWGQSFAYTGFGIDPLRQGSGSAVTAGSATNGLIPTVAGTRYNPNRSYASFIGSGRYTLDRKYTLSLSYRYDGATQAPEKNRWKGFYAAGLGWNVMQENFMKNVDFLDELSFRASYGRTASQFNNDFIYLANYVGGANYAGQNGLTPTFGNSDFDWEYSSTLNIGFDVAFWKRKARVKVDVYDKRTINLVVAQDLSITSGFASGQVNAGEMYNKGIEADISVDVISKKDLLVTLGANFSYNKNKVTSLGLVNEFPSGTSIIRVGLPLGTHFVVGWAGVDPATGNPQYYEKDGVTKSFVYNTATQSVASYGTFIPPFVGGFNGTVRYKGFYVEAFFSFMSGFKRFNNEDFFNENPTFGTSNQSVRVWTDQWRKSGDITDIQKYTTARRFSSKDVQDASFIRFRNLNIGYTFPAKLISRIGVVQGITVYVQGQNLYTWTKWTGFDPEDSNNLASFEYPANRVYTGGIKLDF